MLVARTGSSSGDVVATAQGSALPDVLPVPPFDPGGYPGLTGLGDALFVIENAEGTGAPVTGEFARFSASDGWSVLAPPPRMQQAALATAGDAIALAGIQCADAYPCEQGDAIVTFYDLGSDRWSEPETLRTGLSAGSGGLTSRGSTSKAAVFEVPLFELVAVSPESSLQRMSLDPFVIACAVDDEVLVLSAAIEYPGEDADPAKYEEYEAATRDDTVELSVVNLQTSTMTPVADEVPPLPNGMPGSVNPMCLTDGVALLGPTTATAWRPAAPGWVPFPVSSERGTSINDVISLPGGATVFSTSDEVISLSPEGALANAPSVEDAGPPFVASLIVAVGNQVVEYRPALADEGREAPFSVVPIG